MMTMMSKQTEALKMAIEAMSCISQSRCDPLLKAIRACKEALAEAEKQEPVAWMEEYQSCKVSGDERLCHSDKVFRLVQLLASQSKEWQSLSDDEIVWLCPPFYDEDNLIANEFGFARAIEQALKKKNT